MAPFFYAVHRGYKTGVFDTWAEVELLVKGYPKARYKRFTTQKEALQFVETGEVTSTVIVGRKRKSEQQQTNYSKKKQKQKLNHIACEEKSTKTKIVVYTDGACRNNQNAEQRRASFGVFFSDNDERNTCGMLPIEPYTNQRAELYAILRAFEIYEQQLDSQDFVSTLVIYSDNKYAVDCITQWMSKWRQHNWLTSEGNKVQNLDILKPIDQYIQRFPKTKVLHVPAHCGIYGNECADKLANEALDRYEQYEK